MGVTGLLKLLQPYSETKHVSSYRGQILAVDGYSWLHRAAASCADDIFQGRITTKLVKSIDNRIRSYEMHGVSLYFVFDGSALGIKSRIEKERKAKRVKVSSEVKAGKTASYQQSMRGLEITAQHAAMVIALLKQRQIRFVVAPYEADAQMVWLENQGLVQGIISEDSDLLVFGAKCLLTKSDPKSGTCVELRSERFPSELQHLASLRSLAIVSGCDYSEGVSGLGPVKSGALVRKMGGSLSAVLKSLQLSNRVDDKFIESAMSADLAFQHQRVWDVRRNVICCLNEPENVDIVLCDEFVGAQLNRAVAHKLALGLIDPHNFEKQLIVSPIISQFVQGLKPVATVYASTGSKNSANKPQALLEMQNTINRRLPCANTENALKVSPFFTTKPSISTKLSKPLSGSRSLDEKENFLYQNKAHGIAVSKTTTFSDSFTNQSAKKSSSTLSFTSSEASLTDSDSLVSSLSDIKTLKRRSDFELTKENSSLDVNLDEEIPESDDFPREEINKLAFLNKFKFARS